MYKKIEIVAGIVGVLYGIFKVVLLIVGIKDPVGAAQSKEQKKEIADFVIDKTVGRILPNKN